MPIYSRHCNACDELFDVHCSIALKEEVKECPYCGSVDGSYRPTAVHSSMRSERFMTHKQDNGFKEVISKIQSRHPRTELSER